MISRHKGSSEKFMSDFTNTQSNNIVYLDNLGVIGYVSVCGSKYIG